MPANKCWSIYKWFTPCTRILPVTFAQFFKQVSVFWGCKNLYIVSSVSLLSLRLDYVFVPCCFQPASRFTFLLQASCWMCPAYLQLPFYPPQLSFSRFSWGHAQLFAEEGTISPSTEQCPHLSNSIILVSMYMTHWNRCKHQDVNYGCAAGWPLWR